jgi:hypothetical protein
MGKISNHGEFSWAELFSDQNGKTSGTSFTGIIICMVGTLCFLLGCIDKMWISKSIDIITQSITFVLIGASLMGLKKVMSSRNSDDSTPTIVAAASQPKSQPTDPNSSVAKPPNADEPPLD